MTDLDKTYLTPTAAAYIAAFKALGIPGKLEADARIRLLGDPLHNFDVCVESTVLFRYDAAEYAGSDLEPLRYNIVPNAWDWSYLTSLDALHKMDIKEVVHYAWTVHKQGVAAMARTVFGTPEFKGAMLAAEAVNGRRYATMPEDTSAKG